MLPVRFSTTHSMREGEGVLRKNVSETLTTNSISVLAGSVSVHERLFHTALDWPQSKTCEAMVPEE